MSRKTIAKWIERPLVWDGAIKPNRPKAIIPEFVSAVKAYREHTLTSHHGKIRIAFELKATHACSNPSNVYLVLKQLQFNQAKNPKAKELLDKYLKNREEDLPATAPLFVTRYGNLLTALIFTPSHSGFAIRPMPEERAFA